MKTPIFDFLEEYSARGASRFHMPGHKGHGRLGIEKYDITEFLGADDLFAPSGIIAESEECATGLFGTAHTFYSTEGSSLAIKAMLALAVQGVKKPKILAARAAHKSFVYAAALLDFEIKWLYPENSGHICDGRISTKDIEAMLEGDSGICALYLTSPDYLGNIIDISAISQITKRYKIPLLVDNAHGAYLAFLEPSLHPIALGADMCCDSAHKTLPVLTGGAYLHISKSANPEYLTSARNILSLFASTSPSYLIQASLDLCNGYLSDGYRAKLLQATSKIKKLKTALSQAGYTVMESEPLKIVIKISEYGYTGEQVALYLHNNNIEIEFFDSDYAVLMATPENSDEDYVRLYTALSKLVRGKCLMHRADTPYYAVSRMSVREAMLSRRECVSVYDAVGRVCATPTVSCPPAVPILVSGELVTEDAVSRFINYGIKEIEVVKND